MPVQRSDRNGRSWTKCPLLRIRRSDPASRPERGHCGHLSLGSQAGDVQMVIRGRRIITIVSMQVLEFGVSQIDLPRARSAARFRPCDVQSHDQALRQKLAVQPERFRRQDISDDHLEAVLVKAPGKAAGVVYAQALLRQALRAIPGRGSSRHYELAHVVHLNDRSASAPAGHKASGRALTHRGTARQHQGRPQM